MLPNNGCLGARCSSWTGRFLPAPLLRLKRDFAYDSWSSRPYSCVQRAIMAQLQSIPEQRHDQIYPTLDPLEIERVRRFGNLRSFAAGEPLRTVGQVAPGLMVILAGKVAVAERDQFDNHKPIVVHGPGNFLGELAQGGPEVCRGPGAHRRAQTLL